MDFKSVRKWLVSCESTQRRGTSLYFLRAGMLTAAPSEGFVKFSNSKYSGTTALSTLALALVRKNACNHVDQRKKLKWFDVK